MRIFSLGELSMIKRVIRYLRMLSVNSRVTVGLARAAATANARRIDPKTPFSWEFSGFSQNGEDGIIDYLTGRLVKSNRYFIEIGSSDGLENNTAWMAIARRFSGLMIEGDDGKHARAKESMSALTLGVNCVKMFVTKDNIRAVKEMAHHVDPDLFCLDVDGMDYYLAAEILHVGFRPKVFVVEYNSAFGPDASITIPYSNNFDFRRADESQLYYGVSIGAWKKLFEEHSYKFVTIDQNGVNAFFVDPMVFEKEFVSGIRGMDFRENFYQFVKWKKTWQHQFQMIKHKEFITI